MAAKWLTALPASVFIVAVCVGCTSGASPREPASVDAHEGHDVANSARPGGSDDEAAWQEYVDRWGLPDIRVVSEGLEDIANNHPHSDGALIWRSETLTFVQSFVEGTDDAASMLEAQERYFDEVASQSNLELEFQAVPRSATEANKLSDELDRASREDDDWPSGLALSGKWDAISGTYILEVGEQSDNPDVIDYFQRRWAENVTLSDSPPPFE